jgi:DNA phosphorothioation-dependent restriction protein DptG
MPCIHGLDDNNCPICRMAKSTVPRTPIRKDEAIIENLRPENPFFKKYLASKDQIDENLTQTNKLLHPNLINPLPTPNLINKIPNFENKEFIKKLDDLGIDKLDKYGVSKKVDLENPDLILDDD